MRFSRAVNLLESLLNYEKSPGYDYNLDDYRDFLETIDSPHKLLRPIILIAGTKGKGSTGMMLASILTASGYKVGIFNSPHLIDVRERIRLNNKKIPKSRFTAYVYEIVPKMRSPQGIRSYFEALVTIAISYFLDEKVDYALFEVGMGGRKDATNLLRPIMSLITRVGHDHMKFLGKNLEEIATEKAGIIHDQAPVVFTYQLPSVRRIIAETARKANSSCYYAEELIDIEVLNQDHHGYHLLIRDGERIYAAEFPLLGDHQIENLKGAIVAAKLLGVDEEKIKRGIRKVEIPARVQVFDLKPRIIVDVAHNTQSFNALARVLPRITSGRLFIVFGVSKGKNWSVLRKKILPWSYETIVTRTSLPRGQDPELLARNIKAKVFNRVDNAVIWALDHANPSDTILITGSFYIAGEALATLRMLGFKVGIP